jgi:hypothetical protein
MAEDLSDQVAAPDIDQEFIVPDTVKGQMSVRDAARIMAQQRHARAQEPVSQESAAQEPAAPEPQSAPEADANPPAEDHGETPEAEAAEPPIEPPVSWSSEAREHWRSLPRETQDYLAQREHERERLLTKTQSEVREQQRTFEAERSKLEQARAQYESALPALVESLQQSIAGEFSDIKTTDDVQRLAREDWARYIAWDASQKKLATVVNEAQAAQQRQMQDLQSRFTAFAKEQDALFMQKAPEFADKDKAASLQRSAINVLKDIGFTEEELARQWAGQEALSLRDHRLQLLIRDGVRYREAQTKIKQMTPKPLPPVQRPGVAPAPGRGVAQQIASIEKQLANTSSQQQGARLAAQLLALRREAQGR